MGNFMHRASLLTVSAIMRKMPHKKPLDPLIPLEDLKKVLAGIARVPKDAVTARKPKGKKAPKKSP
jgi:hypothetical protein